MTSRSCILDTQTIYQYVSCFAQLPWSLLPVLRILHPTYTTLSTSSFWSRHTFGSTPPIAILFNSTPTTSQPPSRNTTKMPGHVHFAETPITNTMAWQAGVRGRVFVRHTLQIYPNISHPYLLHALINQFSEATQVISKITPSFTQIMSTVNNV